MNHPAMNAAMGNSVLGAGSLANMVSASKNVYAEAERQRRVSTSTTLFNGKIEVVKVSNGYIVNIGRTEGFEFETHIAQTPEEVNQIIQAQIVLFRLETP